MTRVLWLTPEVPEPGGTGGAIRAYHLLLGLLRRGLHPVVVAPAYPEQIERAAATAEAGVELALVPRPPSQAREALSAHLRHPALAGAFAARPFLGWQADVFWTELAPTVQAQLRTAPQVAVIEHDFCVRWSRALPAALPVGLASHNATWVQLHRDAQHAAQPRRALLAADAARYRRLVRSAMPRFSWWSAVSDGDADALRALGSGAVHLAPNGADTSALADVPAGGGEAGSLLFCGTLSYPPNADAVRWLVRDILPRVRAEEPRARLTVVGRGAPADVERLVADAVGVELLGWVEDLRPVFEASAVALAPLRSGGGTRLKVVEALGAGRATVATTIGAEGLDVQDGVHLLLADDPDAFARAVVGLLRDPAARSRLGAAGRRQAAELYDWQAIADGFSASLAEWIEAV